MPMIIEVNAIHSKVYIYTGTNYTAKKHDLHKSVSSILFMTLLHFWKDIEFVVGQWNTVSSSSYSICFY